MLFVVCSARKYKTTKNKNQVIVVFSWFVLFLNKMEFVQGFCLFRRKNEQTNKTMKNQHGYLYICCNKITNSNEINIILFIYCFVATNLFKILFISVLNKFRWTKFPDLFNKWANPEEGFHWFCSFVPIFLNKSTNSHGFPMNSDGICSTKQQINK